MTATLARNDEVGASLLPTMHAPIVILGDTSGYLTASSEIAIIAGKRLLYRMNPYLLRKLRGEPHAHRNLRRYEVTLYGSEGAYAKDSRAANSPRLSVIDMYPVCFAPERVGSFERFGRWYVASVNLSNQKHLCVLYAIDEEVVPLPEEDTTPEINFDYIDVRDPEATFVSFCRELNRDQDRDSGSER